MLRFLVWWLLTALGLGAAVPCPVPNHSCVMVWSDEFAGNTLDLSKWDHQLGRGCELPSGCGWGNNELQYYQSTNTYVNNGTLKIVARKEVAPGASYTSSRIRTKGRYSRRYGLFEARIKLPSFAGAWPAWWMMSETDSYGGWAASGEIDLMEAKNQCGQAQQTIHYGGSWPCQRSSGQCITDISEGWHVHRFEWRQRVMRWYIDDKLVCTQSFWWTAGAPKDPDAPFDKPFHFILNMAVGGNYAGFTVDDTKLPAALEVDYVRVFTLPVADVPLLA